MNSNGRFHSERSTIASIGELRRTRVLPLLLMLLLLQGCASGGFVARDFRKTYLPRTRLVAVGPVSNLSAGTDAEAAGQRVREAIYRELLARQDRWTVRIQEVAETDRRVRDIAKVDRDIPPAADAEVRVFVTQRYRWGSPLRAATLATTAPSAARGEISLTIKIVDNHDGKEVVSFDIDRGGAVSSSIEEFRHTVGVSVASRFPYRK